jgi:serine/threonine protein phosphatase 1
MIQTLPYRHFFKNDLGRDFVVGDIHGCFTKLWSKLMEIGFNPDRDRLFSVGDLIDRGPESGHCVEWIHQPWFHAVQGNHEDMAIQYPNGNMDPENYSANGGSWNVNQSLQQQQIYALHLGKLPIAIEVQTSQGMVGIVHAECPSHSWTEFLDVLLKPGAPKRLRDAFIDIALWSRDKFKENDIEEVPGIRAVICGHTPTRTIKRLGNTIYIDTMGWKETGHFTILDLDTLEPV